MCLILIGFLLVPQFPTPRRLQTAECAASAAARQDSGPVDVGQTSFRSQRRGRAVAGDGGGRRAEGRDMDTPDCACESALRIRRSTGCRLRLRLRRIAGAALALARIRGQVQDWVGTVACGPGPRWAPWPARVSPGRARREACACGHCIRRILDRSNTSNRIDFSPGGCRIGRLAHLRPGKRNHPRSWLPSKY